MKSNEIKKLINQYGWKLKRHGRSHNIYHHSKSSEYVILERHKDDVAKGMFIKIKKIIMSVNV